MKRHRWTDIKARIKPATRARLEAEARKLSVELHLPELRKARGLTQATMAELLGVSQAEVSKMERRTELYVGTLRKFVKAVDGELILAVRFADGVEVPIRLHEEGAARTTSVRGDAKAPPLHRKAKPSGSLHLGTR